MWVAEPFRVRQPRTIELRTGLAQNSFAPGKKSGRRLPASSRFLVAMACFCLITLGLFSWVRQRENPTRLPAKLAAYTPISRLENFLCSPDNPKIILVGSSLIQCPVYYSDVEFEGELSPKDWRQEHDARNNYVQSRHLARLLRQRFGREVSSWCFAVPGASIADDRLVFEKMLEFGKRPKLLIVCAGVRDFCWDGQRNRAGTPIGQRLSNLHPPARWCRDPMSLLVFVQELCPLTRFLTECSYQWSWDKYILKGKLNQIASRWLGSCGSKSSEMESSRRTNRKFKFDSIIDLYARIYAAQKEPGFLVQLRELTTLTELAASASIPVVVIAMPACYDHQQAIAKSLRDRYQRALISLARNEDVMVIDELSSQLYTDADFDDSLHLLGAGGHRLFNRIVAALAEDPRSRTWLSK